MNLRKEVSVEMNERRGKNFGKNQWRKKRKKERNLKEREMLNNGWKITEMEKWWKKKNEEIDFGIWVVVWWIIENEMWKEWNENDWLEEVNGNQNESSCYYWGWRSEFGRGWRE
jgi:hypothetical protein